MLQLKIATANNRAHLENILAYFKMIGYTPTNVGAINYVVNYPIAIYIYPCTKEYYVSGEVDYPNLEWIDMSHLDPGRIL